MLKPTFRRWTKSFRTTRPGKASISLLSNVSTHAGCLISGVIEVCLSFATVALVTLPVADVNSQGHVLAHQNLLIVGVEHLNQERRSVRHLWFRFDHLQLHRHRSAFRFD